MRIIDIMNTRYLQKRGQHRSWYYTPQEWSRHIGWGTVPDERNWLMVPSAIQKLIRNG